MRDLFNSSEHTREVLRQGGNQAAAFHRVRGRPRLRVLLDASEDNPPTVVLEFCPQSAHCSFFLYVGVGARLQPRLRHALFLPDPAHLGPFEERRLKRYLDRTRNLRKNEPAETVVILGYPDWHKLFGWIKPINFAEEVRWLVRQLEAAGRRFSIYPQATYDDVESLMSNPNVKEVLLFGHGESHGFELRSGEILYYCRFDHPKYRKTLVHQLHCGTSLGTPLREYTVPTENWDKCFFIPEPIRMADIKRRFRPSPTDLESGLE